MEALDLGIKFEILLSEFTSIIYWTSVVGLLMFLFAFSLFLTSPSTSAVIFLYLVNFSRSIVGGIIVIRTPSSDNIIEIAA